MTDELTKATVGAATDDVVEAVLSKCLAMRLKYNIRDEQFNDFYADISAIVRDTVDRAEAMVSQLLKDRARE